jgi:hypothetical protein
VPTEDIRSKGLAVLRDGRLRLMMLRTDANGTLQFADAIVHGHRGDHAVTFNRANGEARWACSCPDNRDGRICSHVYAAEMVSHGVSAPGRDGAPKGKPTPRSKR